MAIAKVSGQYVAFIDYTGATYTSKTVNLPGNWTGANGIVVAVTWYPNAAQTVTGVAAGSNGLTGQTQLSSFSNKQFWIVPNLSGTPGSSIVVTFSAATAYIVIEAWEITGQNTSTLLDVAIVSNVQLQAANLGSVPDAVTTGNITPVTNGCLLIGSCTLTHGTNSTAQLLGATTVWTADAVLSDGAIAIQRSQSVVQATAAAIASTWSITVDDDCLTSVIALRPAGLTKAPPPPRRQPNPVQFLLN